MDPAAITLIAANAVAILSPYLAKAADTVVPRAAEEIYQAVKARFGKKPAAEEALKELESAPADEDVQAAVRVQLKKLLAEDPEFAAGLEELVRASEAGRGGVQVSASGRSVAAGGGIEGSVFTGDVSGDVTVGPK